MRLVSDPELAADVVQETFLRAWRGLDRFRGESQVSTWLHRIAINTALTARRRAARNDNTPLDTMDETAAESTPYSDPERRGEMLDLRARLEAALDELPPGHKAVVVLKDIEGWSHSEIADRLGISESAAKVRLHRFTASWPSCWRRIDERLVCRAARTTLIARSSTPAPALLEGHIATCLRCQATVAHSRRLRRMLERMSVPMPPWLHPLDWRCRGSPPRQRR